MVECFNKIILVSLCDKFSTEVGKTLSQSLDMMFCNAKDLEEYELIDKDTLKKVCSKDYFDTREKSVVKHIASFEDVLVSINYDYLMHNIQILKKNSLIVFLNLSKDYVKQNGNIIDVIDYENRVENLKKISVLNVDIDLVDVNIVCEKIISQLGGILWKSFKKQ